ncbi:hypothetical protein [uncultured Cohaesibacter sp.]|uniref:hypothetical protein n=1 Tax=uncultured Cohaesibacter sp. TaxID=1002546 RepID=UPI0029C8BCDF|nr:hypothetical protein [uncultured Cohaesibacter sp.]
MFRYLFAACIMLAGPALAEDCPNGAVYEATDSEGNLHLLQTASLADPFTFEMQSQGQLVWSMQAEYLCSNGISECWLSVQTNDEEPVDVPVETVSQGESVQYYVFAHLRQTLASMKMDDEQFDTVAQWSMERPDDLMASLAMPVNVYAFKSCK